MVAPCISCTHCKLGNLSLSVATVVFGLPAAINAMERTTSMSFKLVNVNHRHCVFTIDENLRDFFLNDRSLLNCLFHAVNSVISRMFFQMNKSKNFTPSFIMVLHFRQRPQMEPSYSCLISERDLAMLLSGAMSNILTTTFLQRFRTALLNEMRRSLVLRLKM